MLAASRLGVKSAQRTVLVTRATVQTVRRLAIRGIQSVAQTDRVCSIYSIILP